MAVASAAFVAFLIVSHMTVSSTMLILNKAVLERMPLPTTVLLFQVASSALILWVLGKLKILNVDPFELQTAKAFFWNAVAFMCLLFSNAKALESANVESVVVFRTLSIFVTAYGDFRLLQARALNWQMVGALSLVILGAIGFVLSDKGFEIRNMLWVMIYGFCNAAYPVVTKMVIRAKSMTSWGRTYYNNIMTFIIFVPAVFVLQEDSRYMNLFGTTGMDFWTLSLLIGSCIWGTAISFLGFLVLENVSATTFNVMGNCNKLLTLVVNGLLWDKHATLQANMCLFVSLIGAAMYGEAVRRRMNVDKADADAKQKQTKEDEEEIESLAELGEAHNGEKGTTTEMKPLVK